MAYELGELDCEINSAEAKKWYAKAAERGNVNAALALSTWYLTGIEGVLECVYGQAYEYARLAASVGHVGGLRALGYMYEAGIGVKADLRQAKERYKVASECHDHPSIQKLREIQRKYQLFMSQGPKTSKHGCHVK